MKTLVIQSHRSPLPFKWLEYCTQSVQQWAHSQAFDYKWYGNELFQYIDTHILEKKYVTTVIASDLARLAALQAALADYDRVLWLDADFLIFRPNSFQLPDRKNLPEGYMVGRELWIQPSNNEQGQLKCHTKVHNAFLLFDRGNSFLPFYETHAKRLLEKLDGPVPPQFIGPKLLTALHNVIHCPVMESAGMLCPVLADELLYNPSGKQGSALSLFQKKSHQPMSGANLCSSLANGDTPSNQRMLNIIKLLIEQDVPI